VTSRNVFPSYHKQPDGQSSRGGDWEARKNFIVIGIIRNHLKRTLK
jgi:hypothetical protein